MALTIQSRPDYFVLSGNPIEFIISSDTVVTSYHKIHVRIRQNLGSGWIDLAEESLPVVNNTAKFDVSDYVKRKISLNFTIFDLFSKDIKAFSFTDIYFFYFYETYNNDGLNHNQISWGNLRVFQGGFSKIFLNNYIANSKTFYTNFVLDEKRFLTWSPDKKLTTRQHEMLSFITPGSGSSATLRVKYTLYYSDNSTEEINSPTKSLEFGKVHYFFPSFLAQEFDNQETLSKHILKYDVKVESTTGVAYSETKTYYLDRNNYNQGRQFIFKNSLGGCDIIHLKGISENTNEIQRTVGYFSSKEEISFSEFREAFDAASGFLINQYKSVVDAQRYIIELFNSREIYEIIGKELIPVIPVSKKVLIKRDAEFLYSFNFEYEYAYSDEYFSPFDTEQYLNPRLFYSNGQVTPEPAQASQTATVYFDVVINQNNTITFTINWGADVGTTYLTDEVFESGVSRSLQSQITIPGNVSGNRTVVITDSLGGRYEIDYNIGDLTMLFESGEIMQFEDGEIMEFES